ncbi:MAG TPA: MOSC domain-containing protein [Pyrinomonadaceae bacterium]|nr:MOSC domain-containing protein [Pyrinomonadaceae bacterium]
MMKISEINIYPVKSLKGISMAESRVEDRGFTSDRRWMLTDLEGMFFTQREVPKMATLSVEVGNDHLIVQAPETEPLWIPTGSKSSTVRTQKVTVWNSNCNAAVYPSEVNGWFSDVLGLPCQLVEMPETTMRAVDPAFAVHEGEDSVSFADGYPFLLIGETSLGELNSRLEVPVPMNRFRPNLVVSGSEPFAEDEWKQIRVGETIFHLVKPCARCVLTTVDQETGFKDGKEPLKTLASFRTIDNKVLFGQNLIAENAGGVVRVGDAVEVIAYR